MIQRIAFLLLAPLFLLFQPSSAQTFWADDFSDGDFTQNQTWSGNDTNFIVNASNQLQLQAPAVTDESYLSTQSTFIDSTVWQFWVRLDFNPSGSNLARVYLVSDSANLQSAGLSGYYVEIGGTADEVSLFAVQNGTATKIIDGTDGLVATAPTVRVRAFRDVLGNWELSADPTGGNSFVSQGTVFDTTLVTSQYFGILCDYTSTRSDKFFFDDFYVGEPIGDTAAPRLDSFAVASSTALQLFYSENLNPFLALSPSNYTLTPSGIAISPSFGADSSQVFLQLASPLSNLTQYTLQISNQQDASGNASGLQNQGFFYFESDTAVAGDVIINEFFPDPTPSAGLPEKEFVELYNRSNKAFSLLNWELQDASSSIGIFPDSILYPNEYVILCAAADVADFTSYGRVIGLPNFPALNNGADQISIRNAAGNVIDELTYTDSWYRDANRANGGFTLELINPFTNCSGAGNWRASTSLTGGTPGTLNDVFDTVPETDAPEVVSLSVLSTTLVNVVFSEAIDSADFNLANFSVSPALNVVSLQPSNDFTSLEIQLNPIQIGQLYELDLLNLSDCNGNDLNTSVPFGIGELPREGDVIITEIMPILSDDMQLPNAEYVEIYNRTDLLLAVDSLRIEDASSGSFVQSGQFIAPGEYAIICDDNEAASFAPFGKVLEVGSLPSLNNSFDSLKLLFGSGLVLHTVDYSSDWFANPNDADGGVSLEIIDTDNLCGEAQNWTSSRSASGGTPGTINSVNEANPDLSAPELLLAEILDSARIRVLFNEKMDTSSFSLSAVSVEPTIAINSFLSKETRSFTALLNEPLQTATVYTLRIQNVSDCAGNNIAADTEFQLVIPDTVAFGDLVINEILSNPKSSDGSDFIELYNRSNKYINLQDLGLANYDFERDTLESARGITNQQRILFPGAYICLTEDAADVENTYPTAFEKPILEMDLPTFPNTEGEVILFELGKSTWLDRVDYTEEWHFEVLDELDGVSLERIDPEGESQDAENWLSAAENVNFATPGYTNSQRYDASLQGKSNIQLSPEIFSPDNDGFEDVTAIAFALPESGFIANVQIFDQNGQEVRSLVENRFVSQQGQFFWDGTNDAGEKVKVGVYLVFAEFFAPSGEVIQKKLSVVVATRF